MQNDSQQTKNVPPQQQDWFYENGAYGLPPKTRPYSTNTSSIRQAETGGNIYFYDQEKSSWVKDDPPKGPLFEFFDFMYTVLTNTPTLLFTLSIEAIVFAIRAGHALGESPVTTTNKMLVDAKNLTAELDHSKLSGSLQTTANSLLRNTEKMVAYSSLMESLTTLQGFTITLAIGLILGKSAFQKIQSNWTHIRSGHCQQNSYGVASLTLFGFGVVNMGAAIYIWARQYEATDWLKLKTAGINDPALRVITVMSLVSTAFWLAAKSAEKAAELGTEAAVGRAQRTLLERAADTYKGALKYVGALWANTGEHDPAKRYENFARMHSAWPVGDEASQGTPLMQQPAGGSPGMGYGSSVNQ